MWIPYLLGVIAVYFTVGACFETIEDAKQNEYKAWGFQDGPVPAGKLLKSFASGIFLMFCMKYEFSIHVCLLCMIALVGLTLWLSWLRWKVYQKLGSLIVSIIFFIGAFVFALHFWNQIPM